MESSSPLVAALREWVELCMRHSVCHLLHYARERGLSPSQIGALMQIHRRGTCGVSGIGGDLGVTSAAASHLLERLVREDLVVRSEDPRDRRAKQIILTDRGRKVLQESLRAGREWQETLARLLTPDEQDQIHAALTLLSEKASQIESEPTLALD